MPVSDFECQIARGQIGRYLDGGVLSTQTMTGLEEHLAGCPGCKALVAERRAALLETLGGTAPTRAVVSMPVENPLIAALRAKAEAAEPPKAETPKAEPAVVAAPRYAKKATLGKPLGLAALLAIVLVAMSYVKGTMIGPTKKAAASFAAAEIPAQPSAPKPVAPKSIEPATPAKGSDSRETPPAPVPKPIAKPVSKLAPEPTVRATSVPAPRAARPRPRLRRAPARRPAARKARKRPVAARKAPRPSTSVRVYGLDGRPLKP